MTRTVTVQSWTIQAVQSPANLQPTGENLTPQPTQTPADPTCECLFYSQTIVTMRDIAERQEMKACLLHHEQEHKTNPW